VHTSEEGIEKQRLVLDDGDPCMLGPVTNATLKYAIMPVKDGGIIDRNGAEMRPLSRVERVQDSSVACTRGG
jgi:hypothetical protein